MSNLSAEIQRLLAAGEHAATQLRGDELDRITAELVRLHSELDTGSLDHAQLRQVREQMTRFRDLCRFLHDTLGLALHGDPSYQERGTVQTPDGRPLLVEKYG